MQLAKISNGGLGSGYCGKKQYAKVDAGGPYIRCKLIIGGRRKG